VAEIAKRGIVLEVCPTSNILAGIFPTYQDHPLRKLKDAGVRVTLNSDDPGLFNCSIGSEYEVARKEFGFSDKELLETTRTAIEAAFVDEPTRKQLLQKVDNFSFFPNRRPPSGPATPKM
jgi:adenosine deaminase